MYSDFKGLLHRKAVASSCIFAGFLIVPQFIKGIKGIYLSMSALTILLIPFLYIIEWFSITYASVPYKWTFTIAVPNAICWVCVLWICLGIVRKWKTNKWFRAGLCLADVSQDVFFWGNEVRCENVIIWMGK